MVVLLVGASLYKINSSQINSNVTSTLQTGIGGGPGENADDLIADINSAPQNFNDKRVTIVGEVESVKSPRIFLLQEEEGVLDQSILVITKNEIPPSVVRSADNPFLEDDSVLVTGTVKNMTAAEVERDLQLDLDTELEAKFKNEQSSSSSRPVVAADSVTLLESNQTNPTPIPSSIPSDELL